jgi:hypothetical protein
MSSKALSTGVTTQVTEIALGERALGVLFLLRSIFWLTIVFTSMSWTVGDMRPGPHPGPQALGEAVAESGSAVASAAQQAALGQIEAHVMDGAGDKTRQLIEKAALSYLTGKSSNLAAPNQAAPGQAREWCIATDDVCARDATRLTALIAANQSDEADDNAGNGVLLPTPKHRTTVRITAR